MLPQSTQVPTGYTWTLNGTPLPRNPDSAEWPMTKGNASYETMLDGSYRRLTLSQKFAGRQVKLGWKATDQRTRAALYGAMVSNAQNVLLFGGTMPLRQLNFYVDDVTKDNVSDQVWDPRSGQGGIRRDLQIEGMGEPYFRSYYTVPPGQVTVNLAPNSDTLTSWTNNGGTISTGGPSGATDWEVTGNGGSSGTKYLQSPNMTVYPGEILGVSIYCDPSAITSGNAQLLVYDTNTHVLLSGGFIAIYQGSAQRYGIYDLIIPNGTTSIYLRAATNQCSLSNGGVFKFSQPMIARTATINLVPNSDTMSGSMWDIQTSILSSASGGPNGATDWEYTGTGSNLSSNIYLDCLVPVIPGTTYTPSMFMDLSPVTNGNLELSLRDINSSKSSISNDTALSYVSISARNAARYVGPSWTCPVNYAPHSDDLTGWPNANWGTSTTTIGGNTNAIDCELTGTGSSQPTVSCAYFIPITMGATYTGSLWIDQTYMTGGATPGTLRFYDVIGFGNFGTAANIPYGSSAQRYASNPITFPVNVCPEPFSAWTVTGSAAANVLSYTRGNTATVQAFTFSTSSDTATSPVINLSAGVVISLSAQILGAITAGSVTISAVDQNGTPIPGLSLSQTINSNNRKAQSGFTIPNGVTSIKLVASANGATFTGNVSVQAIQLTVSAADPGGYISTQNPYVQFSYQVVSPIVTSGQKLRCAQPMIEKASSASGYYISSQNPQVRFYVFAWNGQSGGFIVANGQKLKFSQPQLEAGTVANPYVSYYQSDPTGYPGFVASDISTWFNGATGVPQWDGIPAWNGNPWNILTNGTVSGSATLTNLGSAPWPGVIRLNGPFNSGSTINVTYLDVDGTGQGVTFTWTGSAITAGNYVLFDTYTDRVYQVIGGTKTEVYTFTITAKSNGAPWPSWPPAPSGNFTVNYSLGGATTATTLDYSNNGTEQFRYL